MIFFQLTKGANYFSDSLQKNTRLTTRKTRCWDVTASRSSWSMNTVVTSGVDTPNSVTISTALDQVGLLLHYGSSYRFARLHIQMVRPTSNVLLMLKSDGHVKFWWYWENKVPKELLGVERAEISVTSVINCFKTKIFSREIFFLSGLNIKYFKVYDNICIEKTFSTICHRGGVAVG